MNQSNSSKRFSLSVTAPADQIARLLVAIEDGTFDEYDELTFWTADENKLDATTPVQPENSTQAAVAGNELSPTAEGASAPIKTPSSARPDILPGESIQIGQHIVTILDVNEESVTFRIENLETGELLIHTSPPQRSAKPLRQRAMELVAQM